MYRISVIQQLAILRQSRGEIVENMNNSIAKGKGATEIANDPPLFIEPLTTAYPGEPVVCTPGYILLHPAYDGGWKVLQHFRPDGRAYLTFVHETHGRFRSKKQVLNHLDYLLRKKEKESADQAEQGCGANQQAQGMGASSSASPLAEGKPSAVTIQSAEGSCAASASNSFNGMSNESC